MDIDELAELLRSLPEARVVSTDLAYWKNVVSSMLPHVLDEIATSFDWDFALNEYSSVTTVSGTAEYALEGQYADMRDIVSIRYGTTNKVLQKFRALDAHDLLVDGTSFGGVGAWYQSGVDSNGFPKVILMDTPSEAKSLTVMYRKKNIPLAAFPPDFGYVIARGVLSWVSDAKRLFFEMALKKMIKRHKVGGKDYNPMQMDPQIVRTNNDIADLYGVG